MKTRFTAVVALVLTSALVWFAFGDLVMPPTMTVVEVGRGTAVEAVYGTAHAEPLRTVTLRAPVSGTVSAVRASAGDTVVVETPLAEFDVPTLVHDLAAAQIDLAAAEDRVETVPGVRALRAESAAVEARAELSRTEIERVGALAERGLESAATLDRLRTELAGHEATLSALRAQRRDAAAGTATDAERQRVLVSRARALIEQTIVRAPFDGLILERLVEPHEWVAAGQELLRLGDISEFRVEAEIDESDVALVSVGAEAVVGFYALPDRRFVGEVVDVGVDADRARGTYGVTIRLEDAPPTLQPGLSAEVNIVVRRVADAILVPSSAIDADRVWVVEDGRARSLAPVWGVRGTTSSEAVEGIDAGTRVIDRPPADLTDGARVRIAEVR